MGWVGSYLACDLIDSLRHNVKSVKVRKEIYRDMYDSLRSMDWDTVDESLGIDPVFDEVVQEKEPDWFDTE